MKVEIYHKDEILRDIRSILDEGTEMSHGIFTRKFEEEFEKITGLYAAACNSGTTAVEVAIRSLGLVNKRIGVPSMTVPMVKWAVEHSGNIPVFYDVSEEHISYDFSKIPVDDIDALILVHTGGIIDPEIKSFIKKFNKPVIEDCSHAHLCKLNGEHAGSFGDVAAFSFFPTKVLTACEGGIVASKNKDIIDFARKYVDLGYPEWENGYNLRISELNAVVGYYECKYYRDIINDRIRQAKIYHDHGIYSQQDKIPGLEPTYYKFTITLPPELHKEVRYTGYTHVRQDGDFENAVYWTKNHLNLLLWRGLPDEEIIKNAEAVKRCLEKAKIEKI
jgi:dTDP-4-amino-4,6-dideoxygalactose transaminase